MRLRVSGDKPEIRQQYIPAMWPKLVKPLIDIGSVSICKATTQESEESDDVYRVAWMKSLRLWIAITSPKRSGTQ